MLAYLKQAAERYLELLEHSDDNDGDNTVTYSKEEIQLKLANAIQAQKALYVDGITALANKGYYNEECL